MLGQLPLQHLAHRFKLFTACHALAFGRAVEAELVAGKPWDHVEMMMKHFLAGRFAI